MVNTQRLSTRCCIVGGGPAGVMLGFLLARWGVEVEVLEKHKDFFRDFRGDTIHPSTLSLMDELGLLQEFLRQPHQRVTEISGYFGAERIHIADFTHVPAKCKFVAFLPQWDFLNFLSSHARKLPNFHLRMDHEVIGVLTEGERVVGVKGKMSGGEFELRADLVVGADGRSSTVRENARLEVVDVGAPIDVLWFRLPKLPKDPPQAFGFVGAGQFMVLIDRAEYWQCAYVIRKDSFADIQRRGLEQFRNDLRKCAPFLANRVEEIRQWDEVKLLNVRVDYLRQWHRDGLLCIGDAAHAMSPVGGVGINLAIQDAVATANILGEKLRRGPVNEDDLKKVQKRRERPARLTQQIQVFIHRHVLEPIFDSTEPIAPPSAMRLLERFPRLRRLPARMIGIGFRPEHIQNP